MLAEPLIISTSKRDDHQLDMTIQLGPERTDEALHRAARQVSKRAKIPGFRPGKAPYATVLRMFGRDALLGQVMEEMGDEIYKEALEVERIEPYGRADLEDLKTDPVTFKLVVPLLPEVHLGDYRSIRIAAPEVSMTEADVDAVLERAAEQRKTVQSVERASALGDTVVVDIHGTAGEDTIMDNHDWEVALEGGESGWLPGFDDAFVGMLAGDERTFTLKYPEDSASRYRGQEATFHATLKEVRAKARPAIDDEFARSLGDYADLAALRAETREEITRQRTAEAEDEFNGKIVEALVEGATFGYPAAAVDDMIHEMLSELEARVSPVGYSLQDFLRLQGTTVEAYHEQLRPAAERRMKSRLALSEFAKVEGITIAPEESQAELDRLAGGAADEDRAKSIRETFGSASGQRFINQDLLTRKALARLREIAAGPAPEPTGVGGAEPRAVGGAEVPATATVAGETSLSPAPPGPEELGESAGKKKRAKKKQSEQESTLSSK
jgi:trigger factor